MAVHTMNKELINEAKKHLISIKYDNLNPIIKNFTNAGELCLLGGRPAMGKTSFSLNIAAEMLKQGKRVVIISLENMAYQIIGKLIPLFIDNENDFDNAVNQIISSGLIIDDTSLINVDDLFNKEYVNQADFIVIDYLGLISVSQKLLFSSRKNECEYVLKRLKQLSTEKEISILVNAQLSHKIECRDNKRPLISYFLIDEKIIREYTDNVIFLYRDEMYNENTEQKGILKSNIIKTGNNCSNLYYHNSLYYDLNKDPFYK